MKFLIAFVAIAFFACVSAGGYGNIGLGGYGLGNVGYLQNHGGGYGRRPILISKSSNPSAAAAAAAASSGVNSGLYNQRGVIGYELDGGILGGHGGYGGGLGY
ncbi:chorion protein S15 [Drosophila grimshawi]|uniref:Chorion protein S15 n=1 Tax=Drosophila grimshawi TaxID=7222 RepID=CH15_DROGR|nr:chorion protein S15 [Drosophila grimshawi]P13425.2 RecName: Full=Chorion protein S15; Flags: Precursor [Drosophila grimshawi]CAA37505.1 chorion protein s15 [Drosophila grimshawi]